jgi:hypothetical protein
VEVGSQAGGVGQREPFARGPVFGVAAVLALVLVLLAGRYGYHRDELYFLAAGRHLAWGYPDMPVLAPLVARLASAVAPGSLVVLRVPSALAMAAVVVLAAVVARDLGARRSGQVFAAACVASSSVVLAVGHLLTTPDVTILAWTGVLLMSMRALRGEGERWWLGAGVMAGFGLLGNALTWFLLAGLFLGILATRRDQLRSGWLWAGAALAVAAGLPYLVWQAANGWPQLEVSRSIAAGGSGTSASRLAFLPFQLALVSPWLVPVWVWGLVRLVREPRLRVLGMLYPFLAIVFIVTGGKPYYIVGMYPFLLAAGAQPFVDFFADPRWVPVAALALSLPAVLVVLPLVPVDRVGDTPIVEVNYDAGETIGWPTYVGQITAAAAKMEGGAPDAILTNNYGEAGALERYGPPDLPAVYSGQDGYWLWGPPPDYAHRVLGVGFTNSEMRTWCRDPRRIGTLENHLGIANDEQGAPVWSCTSLTGSWETLWPSMRHT